jgi:hypothetical protein
MIDLDFPLNSARPRLIQPGFVVRGARGTVAGQVILPGACYGVEATFESMPASFALKLQADLELAKIEGLRFKMPLNGISQGMPGLPVVDGSAAAGTSLPLRGLTSGYAVKKGYWLTVIDAAGNHCLHRVAEPAVADGDGKATLTLVTPLRTVLVDGDTVVLAAPTIEGVITSDVGWDIPMRGMVEGLGFSLEETEAA